MSHLKMHMCGEIDNESSSNDEGNHEWHWSGSKEWDAGTVQGWHMV